MLELATNHVADAAVALADSITTGDREKSDELSAEAEAAVEAFYTSAFQLSYDLRYYDLPGISERFDPLGVNRVRNMLIVHTHKGLKGGQLPPPWSIALGGDGDARLRFTGTHEAETPWLDQGMYANAQEYVDDFNRIFAV